ncbi:MAG TPA: hypothetical protein VJ795_01100 [Rheinheimera sp.]|uniref:hypothetical protein n=1 Tax=Rheinheimera sp. TaxID=1869214 RepID=UPI002B484962|nr:hypothetical protein [Rheinheimera sp.]HJS13639.1 hypothetical protein [Rheinheimera sp.]
MFKSEKEWAITGVHSAIVRGVSVYTITKVVKTESSADKEISKFRQVTNKLFQPITQFISKKITYVRNRNYKGFTLMETSLITVLLVVTALIGYLIVYKNINTKDVVFAYTALMAAIVMFILNVFLNLKEENFTEVTQPYMYEVDGKICLLKVHVRNSMFALHNYEQLNELIKLDINKKEDNPVKEIAKTAYRREQIENYMKLMTLGTLIEDLPNWSPEENSFRTGRQVRTVNNRDDAGVNSFYELSELVKGFKVEDFFTEGRDIEIWSNGMTLPPDTEIRSNGKNLIFENPFVLLTIEFEASGSLNAVSKDSIGRRVMTFPTSQEDIAYLIDGNIYVNVKRKKFRTGSNEYEIYTKWVKRITDSISTLGNVHSI